jgi:hypothetical protein
MSVIDHDRSDGDDDRQESWKALVAELGPWYGPLATFDLSPKDPEDVFAARPRLADGGLRPRW